MTHSGIQVLILVHRSTGTALAWPNDRDLRFLLVSDENDLRHGVFDGMDFEDEDGGPRYEPISKRRVRGFTVRDRSHHTKRRSFRDLN